MSCADLSWAKPRTCMRPGTALSLTIASPPLSRVPSTGKRNSLFVHANPARVCVCVYACMRMRIYVCMYARMRMCMCVCMVLARLHHSAHFLLLHVHKSCSYVIRVLSLRSYTSYLISQSQSGNSSSWLSCFSSFDINNCVSSWADETSKLAWYTTLYIQITTFSANTTNQATNYQGHQTFMSWPNTYPLPQLVCLFVSLCARHPSFRFPLRSQDAYVDTNNNHIANGFDLGDPYYERAAPVVDLQLQRAGLRMANLFNTLFP
jgi:hypothetical protein